MDRLFVYADFDWLAAPTLVGELSFDSVRGNETYSFSYDKEWLAKYGDIFLSEDLQNFPGVQYTRPERDIFSCFSDALPDRWGRTLLNRREQIAAADEKRPVKRLTSFDYLMGIDDASRVGGFRFTKTKGGEFINVDLNLRVPPLTSVRELIHAAHEIEESEEKQQLPAKKWLVQLLHPGTSLGGARPKATVVDEDGKLTVAKFPSRKDDYDVALWEHFCHVMGRKAGLNVAETRIINGENHHVLLSKRFDRNGEGKRIHFASALTLLGLEDGDNASTGFGYPDIVDFIIQHGSNVEQNLEELYKRVAFYIIVGNSDDHFRNHGFLLTRKGWELSPAYDINPTLQENQSLLINRSTNESDLNILLESANDYMLSKDKAARIISEVKEAMKSWQTEARRIGIPIRDIDVFAPRIDKWLV
ncbi:type II toxin-antitoxin system HipA family toxin [uncultured Muribaculum sp.]|uniref:type II toxin-antitoxin system HipA family toxin n=1 Tax=uncultured Muribaculum sp. TaxID=1918613 RepID=UPI00259152E7|nr:type II toxin-antitoxin system HipA family toxin [uncultured Muribaculum sp.]